MSPRRIPIDFFFDVFSPYSWIGFEGLIRYSQVWPIDVSLRPFYFAGVIKATGNRGAPLSIEAKERYLDIDLRRNGDYWKIPISLPEVFPCFRLYYLRALMLVIMKLLRASIFYDRLVCSFFFEKIKVLKTLPVKDVDSLFQLASSKEIKAELRRNTDEALSNGCFGAPWIHVRLSEEQTEPFFGSDRLPLIGHLIGEQYQGPLRQLANKASDSD
ncbi:unnamed protein product [Heligmosomoides polygyrus]|uniref:Glutathione S-transferase kappa n=1 Tax=Heligmosomoides polygyrus TaxID=6339 RepID=A0A183FNJ9_HELPZ|nr:unnamed protein product [Heligmosomoides polygyrus]